MGKTAEYFLRKEWQSHTLLLLRRKGYNDQDFISTDPCQAQSLEVTQDTAPLPCPGSCGGAGTEPANSTMHGQERLLTINEK